MNGLLIGPDMRPIRSLLIYFAVVFLGGSLLAPWLYWFTHWAAMSALAATPFHRYLARALEIIALLSLVPLLSRCEMLRWRALGLGKQGRPAVDLLQGFCLGFASLACVALLALAAHGRVLAHAQSPMQLINSLLITALVAVIVAVIEEILFRGALFGILRQA
ncbi:MAG TPA: hypothetical protein VH619_03595, partial [Verrucomicrobiae bacterium]|nr:hypothetical protein [Verrucomicrobiae bacterium]